MHPSYLLTKHAVILLCFLFEATATQQQQKTTAEKKTVRSKNGKVLQIGGSRKLVKIRVDPCNSHVNGGHVQLPSVHPSWSHGIAHVPQEQDLLATKNSHPTKGTPSKAICM